MTDIWRSFVAQRIAWAQGWSILCPWTHRPPASEPPRSHATTSRTRCLGYLHNRRIAAALERSVASRPACASIPEGMRQCYEALRAVWELVA